jgi:hypothetical protein
MDGRRRARINGSGAIFLPARAFLFDAPGALAISLLLNGFWAGNCSAGYLFHWHIKVIADAWRVLCLPLGLTLGNLAPVLK